MFLDEASSSLDLASDRAIQKVLRTAFNDCTVVVVAHRLSTIIDSDLVFVLSHGRIIEAGAPSSLLQEPGSAFAKLNNGGSV